MKKSYLLTLMPAAIITTLSACNSGNNNSNTFTPTALTWESCDPEIYSGVTDEMIESLGNRLTCTKMIAPIDYSNPSFGTLEVAISKVSARIPAERKGSIFFNPGGPGGDGIELAPNMGRLWSEANPSDPLGAKFNQLSDEYDLIGFTPRGVISSTPLRCQQLGSSFYSLNHTESIYSEHNQYTLFSNQELTASACRANLLTPFINTDTTARDMDLIRSSLGDAKISYIGYSYGTWLGTWYAGLFPSHVDKMVLDSNMDITNSLIGSFQKQPQALQNILDNIVAPYAALNESIFNLGTTQDVQNIYPNLNNAMQSITSNYLYSSLFKQIFVTGTLEILSAAKATNLFITNNPYANKQQITQMISEYTFSSDASINHMSKFFALNMTDTYFTNSQQSPEIVSLGSSSSTNRAVICNDAPSPTSFEYWYNFDNTLKSSALAFAGGMIEANCTAIWNGPTVTQPSVTNMRSASPILMVQTQYDGATPLDGALKTYNALGTAGMVYITNSYTHGVFSSLQNGCADNAIASYLLTGEMPENQLLICQGEGLLPNMNNTASISSTKTNSTSFLPASLANKATYGENININNAFNNPEQARKIQEQIQDSVINAEKINNSSN